MRKIQVLLAIRSGILSAVIRHILERQPDMEVVGDVSLLSELEVAMSTSAAESEVVITSFVGSEGEKSLCHQWLPMSPRPKIMILSPSGSSVQVFGEGSVLRRIEKVSEASLLGAIRESVN